MLPPKIKGCIIHRYDVGAETGMRLHPNLTPCEWEHEQWAIELWLARVLQESWPWTSASPSLANVTYVDGLDLARWCTVTVHLSMREYTRGRFNVSKMTSAERLCSNTSTPIARASELGFLRRHTVNGRRQLRSSTAQTIRLASYAHWRAAPAYRRADGVQRGLGRCTPLPDVP